MKIKKKRSRSKNIWYSIWNRKNIGSSPKCEATYQPIRHSEK